jgi:type IX secretion system PorP/SprF family membrane protein
MKRNVFILILCICLKGHVSYGQQYLYSQYFANPLSINPALTGHFEGSYRFSSITRSQWAEDGNPFRSLGVSFEKALLESSSSGKLGIGLLASSDNSNMDAFSVKRAALSVAYNMELDAEGNVELGAGFQGQYNQRRINPYNLTFESQFGSGGFNTGMATPEMSKASTMSYTSFNAGLLLNVKSLEVRRV